ncbi:MAG: helix-turn-helix domain-containing protein [Candidatus Dormibacteria bacterium]
MEADDQMIPLSDRGEVRARSDASGDVIVEVRLHSLPAALGPARDEISILRKLLTVEQSAEILGVSRPTIFKLLDVEIPRITIGRNVRIHPDALEDYIQRQTAALMRHRPLKRSA